MGWRAWTRWKDLATRAATWQARLLLGLFYWVVLAPFALAVRLLGDPLGLRGEQAGRWQRPPQTRPPRQG
jgi:hypothetical protein